MSEQVRIFPFTKEHRFAVVKKQPRYMRHRCDFKHLHTSRQSAEDEAVRLTQIHKTKFYIVEIVAITSSDDTDVTDLPDKTPEEKRSIATSAGIIDEASLKDPDGGKDICENCGRTRDGHSRLADLSESGACERFKGTFLE